MRPTFSTVPNAQQKKLSGLGLELLCSGFDLGSTTVFSSRESVIEQLSWEQVPGLHAAHLAAGQNAGDCDPRQDELQLLEAMLGSELQIEGNRLRVNLTVSDLADCVLSDLPTFVLDVLLPDCYPLAPPFLLFYPLDQNCIVPLHVLQDFYSFCFDLQPGNAMLFSLIDFVRDYTLTRSSPEPPTAMQSDAERVPSETNVDATGPTLKTAGRSKTQKDRHPRREDIVRAFPHRKSESKSLQELFKQKTTTAKYAEIQREREALPVTRELRNKLLGQLDSKNVVVVSSETGSGKSSQIPQMLFEELVARGVGGGTMIICTQPRRLSATALAMRVASELQTEVGDLVGYAIRQESKRSQATRILFTTTGYLLRLISSSDRYLASTSTHLIIDEVHERSQEIDFLLALLRQEILPMRNGPTSSNPLKLVLMSATANTTLLSNYFDRCPVFTAPGRMFDVEEIYLEQLLELGKGFSYSLTKLRKTVQASTNLEQGYSFDPELIVQLVQYVHHTQPPGAVLIFVPGAAQIGRLVNMITALGNPRLHVLGLHSSISLVDQQEVFRTVDPPGRKIVVSTNICETSLTIPDVVYVIDSGRANVLGFDTARGISLLQDQWVARANAQQRKGRAGRCQEGRCFRLFTRAQFEQMPANEEPEILRAPLHHICLQILLLGRQPAEFLPAMVQPPSPLQIEAALATLQQVKAVEGDRAAPSLTSLGCHLALLPTDVHIGKLLIFASLLGCSDPMLTVAAFMTLPSPYKRSLAASNPAATVTTSSQDSQRNTDSDDDNQEIEDEAKPLSIEQQRSVFRGSLKSDLMSLANMYRQYSGLKAMKDRREFCAQYGLSPIVLEDVKKHRVEFARYLKQLGFAESNKNAQDPKVCSAVLCEALWPHVISVEHPPPKFRDTIAGAVELAADPKAIKHRLKDGTRVFIHPQSLYLQESKFDSNWLCFSELVQTTKPFVRDVNMIFPIAMLLFGPRFQVSYATQELVIDQWIRFAARPCIGYLLLELRRSVDLYLLLKFKSPQLSSECLPVDDIIVKLIKTDGWL